jgi:hypothetical protein
MDLASLPSPLSLTSNRPSNEPSSGPRGLLLVIACLSLALGLLVYLTDRRSGTAWLIASTGVFGPQHLFGDVGQWLPSFVHPFAFSLLTAAVLAPTAQARLAACAAWAGVNLLFEAGQHRALSGPLSHLLLGPLAGWPGSHMLARYFVQGRFDPGDLAAVLAGALAAAAVLHLLPRCRS